MRFFSWIVCTLVSCKQFAKRKQVQKASVLTSNLAATLMEPQTFRERAGTHHLLRRHDDCLDAEPPATHIKQVLQARSEQVDHQNVVQALVSKVVDLRDTRTSGEDFVGPVFVSKLRGVRLSGLKLDGDGLRVEEVGTWEKTKA